MAMAAVAVARAGGVVDAVAHHGGGPGGLEALDDRCLIGGQQLAVDSPTPALRPGASAVARLSPVSMTVARPA